MICKHPKGFRQEQKDVEKYEHPNLTFRCLPCCSMTSAYGNAFTVNGKSARLQRAISSSMVLPNLRPSYKSLPAKSTTYRNLSILEKKDVDHALDDELTAVPTIDQEVTFVDSQTVDEQDGGIRVAEIDQQMLSDFLDRNRRAQASDSLPSEVRHYSAKQLFR